MSYNIVKDGELVNIAGGGGSDIEQFIGTQQEWNDLPAADKTKYDGKEVIITDDYEDDKKLNWSYSKITLPYTAKNDGFCVINCAPTTSDYTSYFYLNITRDSEKLLVAQNGSTGSLYSIATPIKKGDVLSINAMSSLTYNVYLYEA